ncbi:hypothetical protein ACA910_007841 [Epithemia clementina (nom. ined.)]
MKSIVGCYAEEGRLLPKWDDNYEGESLARSDRNAAAVDGNSQTNGARTTNLPHEQGTSYTNGQQSVFEAAKAGANDLQATPNDGGGNSNDSDDEWEGDDSDIEEY